jgi:outer membrane immunogenic protein
MKRLLSASVLALAVAATPAAAQSDTSWTGGYVGAQIGYNIQPSHKNESVEFDTSLDGTFGDTVNTAAPANAFSPGFCGGAAIGNAPAAGCRSDRDRILGAIHAGYDYQMGNIVIGAVAEYGRTSITDSVSAFSTTPASYTLTRNLRDNAALRARIGYAMNNTLVYGTGGVAYGRVRNRFSTTNTVNTFTNSGDEDAYGYRVGGGLEQRLGAHFSMGLQYTYTSLKDGDFRVRAQGPAPAANPFIRTNASGTDFRRSNDRFDTHAVALTANYRF